MQRGPLILYRTKLCFVWMNTFIVASVLWFNYHDELVGFGRTITVAILSLLLANLTLIIAWWWAKRRQRGS